MNAIFPRLLRRLFDDDSPRFSHTGGRRECGRGTGTIEARNKENPDGILFNTRKTIPYLKQIGVTDKQIRTITVDNPRRFFA